MSTWAGNLIRLARRDAGLSQRELARRADTSQAAIAGYEAGRHSPSIDTLARIVRAAGMDLRINLVPGDGHDEWLQRFEDRLAPDVVAARRARDRELIAAARGRRVGNRADA